MRRSLRKFVASALLVTLLLVASPEARATGIPVIDAANLVENTLAEINQYLSYLEEIKQLVELLREGQYFTFLTTLLNDLEVEFPATEIGSFASEVLEAHDAWMGVADYGVATRDRVDKIFGGSVPLPEQDARYQLIDFLDASSIRTAKEVGSYRSKRDARKTRMEQMIDKANGSTGEDRQLQLANTTLANVYGSLSELGTFIGTTNELLAVQLQVERANQYTEAQLMDGSEAGITGLVSVEADKGEAVPKIAIP